MNFLTKMAEIDEVERVYEAYRCVQVPEGCFRAQGIVETVALSQTPLPPCDYPIMQTLSTQINQGLLMDIQVEGIMYACQQFRNLLPNGHRCGFLLGDSTGLGKGRQIAGIIADATARGLKKHLWVSQNINLMDDANRDFRDLKLPLRASKCDFEPWDTEIGFATYHAIRINLAKVIEWFGEGFEGVIVFDECQNAKERTSKIFKAVVELQNALPRARILYVSATAVSEIQHMEYLTRLGLFGPGTYFQEFQDFYKPFQKKNLAALELLSCSLKSAGRMVSRQAGFANVRFDVVSAQNTLAEKNTFERIHGFIRKLFNTCQKAQAMCNQVPKEESYGLIFQSPQWSMTFWGMQYRVADELMTSMKVATVIAQTRLALNDNKSVVIGINRTGESNQKEAEKDAVDFTETTSQCIESFIKNQFPVRRNWTLKLDDPTETECDLSNEDLALSISGVLYAGRIFAVELVRKVFEYAKAPSMPTPGYNSDGVIYKCKILQDAMLKELNLLSFPPCSLDSIIDGLGGSSEVAEMTGRCHRQVRKENGQIVLEPRTGSNIGEQNDFQRGTKRVAIISKSCSTGISLHSDRNAKNQQQRVHITLDITPDIVGFTQQLGRTNRTNQISLPIYILIQMGIAGEARIAYTINKKMKSLGAITRGNRNASTEIPSIETHAVALKLFLREVKDERHHQWAELKPWMDWLDFGDKHPTIKQFLNRIVSLPIDVQEFVCNAFFEKVQEVVLTEKESGKFDRGLLNIETSEIRQLQDPEVLFTDRIMNQTLQIVNLQRDRGLSWEQALREAVYRIRLREDGDLSRNDVVVEPRTVEESTTPWCNFFVSLNYEICLGIQFEYHKWVVIRPKTGLSGAVVMPHFLEKFRPLLDANEIQRMWEYEYKDGGCIHGVNCTSRGLCTIGSRFTDVILVTGYVLPYWLFFEKLQAKANKHVAISIVKTMVNGLSVIGVLIRFAEEDLKRLIYEKHVTHTVYIDTRIKLPLRRNSDDRHFDMYGLIWEDGIVTFSSHPQISIGEKIIGIANRRHHRKIDTEQIMITSVEMTNQPLEQEGVRLLD